MGYEICPECKGEKKVECYCIFKGRANPLCNNCGGKGKVTCAMCAGKGKIYSGKLRPA